MTSTLQSTGPQQDAADGGLDAAAGIAVDVRASLDEGREDGLDAPATDAPADLGTADPIAADGAVAGDRPASAAESALEDFSGASVDVVGSADATTESASGFWDAAAAWVSDAWAASGTYVAETWTSGIDIWTKGGWAMVPLALISLFIFFVGIGVQRRLGRLAIGGLSDATWRRWIHEPDAREGIVGTMFDHVSDVTRTGNATIHDGFDELRIAEVEPFERDLKLMSTAVGAAPLVGLLGTVTGMLATFRALGEGSGGDQTMSAIASGISEALYTTETGLIVALPGLFFHYFLSRRFERFRDFLVHAEAAWSKETLEAELDREERSNKERMRTLVAMELKRRVLARIGTAGAAPQA
ncbi:MAG: MotA/TolQ/ExbB proton channel family protein [Planctomycetota bacterium]